MSMREIANPGSSFFYKGLEKNAGRMYLVKEGFSLFDILSLWGVDGHIKCLDDLGNGIHGFGVNKICNNISMENDIFWAINLILQKRENLKSVFRFDLLLLFRLFLILVF